MESMENMICNQCNVSNLVRIRTGGFTCINCGPLMQKYDRCRDCGSYLSLTDIIDTRQNICTSCKEKNVNKHSSAVNVEKQRKPNVNKPITTFKDCINCFSTDLIKLNRETGKLFCICMNCGKVQH